MKVKRTERGWAGHYICAPYCRFRRNTLLEYGDIKIVVSTVGTMYMPNSNKIETVGCGRYYETMAFHSKTKDTIYNDIDAQKQVYINSKWCIGEEEIENEDVDNIANDMHENVVEEITSRLKQGKI